MTLSPIQQKIAYIIMLLLALLVLYVQYLRPTPLTLDTIVPTATDQTHITFALENDTLLFPTQCLHAKWDMNNTRGIYINHQGVAAPETQTFCHLPQPSGVFIHLRVMLPDDTSITYDFKVRVLAYDPIFLTLCVVIVGMFIAFFIDKLPFIRWLLGGIGVLGCSILIGMIIILASRFLETRPTVWDDALMFARYAHNLQATGIWTWNAGEAPVFGMTELAYGAMVYNTTIQNPHLDPIQAVQSTSAAMGFVWMLFIAFICIGYGFFRKHTSSITLISTLFLVLMGLSAHTNILHHFTSGMGTTTALAYVTLYLMLTSTYRHATTIPSQVVMGIFGGLGFAIRPDVMLFTICVPIALWLFAKAPKARRNALIFGMATLITLGVQLLIARLYFGSALPLPFFAKSGGIYDGYLANQYVAVAIDQLGVYLHSNRYLLALILAGILINYSGFIKRISAVEIGLVAGMIGYIGYYAVFVTQIMPEYQRFYYPTLPIIVWLAFIGTSAITERLWGSLPVFWDKRTPYGRIGGTMSIIALMVIGLSSTLYDTHQFLYHHETAYYPPHDARWYKLAEFSTIDNLTVATTEVGAVAVANYSWRVIDMAGLNDTRFALDGFSADILLDDYRPDLIYLPYPDYIAMTQAIVTHPSFIADYTYFTAGQIRLPMGIAIRNDSRAYSQLFTITQDS